MLLLQLGIMMLSVISRVRVERKDATVDIISTFKDSINVFKIILHIRKFKFEFTLRAMFSCGSLASTNGSYDCKVLMCFTQPIERASFIYTVSDKVYCSVRYIHPRHWSSCRPANFSLLPSITRLLLLLGSSFHLVLPQGHPAIFFLVFS